MKSKTIARLKRAARSRSKIKKFETHRLSVHRTPRHIYAQVITSDGSCVIVSASTLDKEIRNEKEIKTGKTAAAIVGQYIAKRALSAGIKTVAFDRSGYCYHGRIKALADAARESGLEF